MRQEPQPQYGAIVHSSPDPSVPSSTSKLGDDAQARSSQTGPQSDVSCVALSAEYGYIYRAASQLGKTQFFEFLDKKYVDKIGLSEFGRQWGRWSEQEKLENVYRVVTDPAEYRQRLKECNFSALLKELEEHLGAEKQVGLISRQIEFALDQLLKHRGAEIDFGRGCWGLGRVLGGRVIWKALLLLCGHVGVCGKWRRRFIIIWMGPSFQQV